jgi:hypothetical protein
LNAGVDQQRDLTCINPDEAELNRVMVQQARRKIAVADSSKFGVVAKWLIAPIADVDVIVTDTGITEEKVTPFRELGITVHIVYKHLSLCCQVRVLHPILAARGGSHVLKGHDFSRAANA